MQKFAGLIIFLILFSAACISVVKAATFTQVAEIFSPLAMMGSSLLTPSMWPKDSLSQSER